MPNFSHIQLNIVVDATGELGIYQLVQTLQLQLDATNVHDTVCILVKSLILAVTLENTHVFML